MVCHVQPQMRPLYKMLIPEKPYNLTLPLLGGERGSVHFLLHLSVPDMLQKDKCDSEQNDVTKRNYVNENMYGILHIKIPCSCSDLKSCWYS